MLRKSLAILFLFASLAVLAVGWHRWERSRSQGVDFDDLHRGTQRVQVDSFPTTKLRYSEGKSFSPVKNLFLGHVDEVLDDADERIAIGSVQPACVSVGAGSGVCIDRRGYVLTNAHVAKALNQQLLVTFPDGGQFVGTCVALNRKWDLALIGADVRLNGKYFVHFPVAKVASLAPVKGDKVICVGQPASMTPGGQPTDYKRFKVSIGSVLEVDDDPLGDHSTLGRVRHDAWTYWGHSGSPLFNTQGQIVALHSSWDATRSQRHGVTQQAIAQFLIEGVPAEDPR